MDDHFGGGFDGNNCRMGKRFSYSRIQRVTKDLQVGFTKFNYAAEVIKETKVEAKKK